MAPCMEVYKAYINFVRGTHYASQKDDKAIHFWLTHSLSDVLRALSSTSAGVSDHNYLAGEKQSQMCELLSPNYTYMYI